MVERRVSFLVQEKEDHPLQEDVVLLLLQGGRGPRRGEIIERKLMMEPSADDVKMGHVEAVPDG